MQHESISDVEHSSHRLIVALPTFPIRPDADFDSIVHYPLYRNEDSEALHGCGGGTVDVDVEVALRLLVAVQQGCQPESRYTHGSDGISRVIRT